MTSPGVNGNGQKDNGKSDSSPAARTSSEAQIRAEPVEARPTPFFSVWWRVFKLANLLMQQGC